MTTGGGASITLRRGPRPADNFTMIWNPALRDRRLSRRARGILAELLSHDVGWETSVRQLQEGGPEGRDALIGALKELETYGYLQRERIRNEDGLLQSGSVYYVTDNPAALMQSSSSEPVTENPSQDATSKNASSRGRRGARRGQSPSSEPVTENPSQVPTSKNAAGRSGASSTGPDTGNQAQDLTWNFANGGDGSSSTGPKGPFPGPGFPGTGFPNTKKTNSPEDEGGEDQEDQTPAPSARSAVPPSRRDPYASTGPADGGASAAQEDIRTRRNRPAPKVAPASKEQRRSARKVARQVFPAALAALLPANLPNIVVDLYVEQVEVRTTRQLAARSDRRWVMYGYDMDLAAGRIHSPTGVAVELIRNDGPCPDPRCEDGFNVDTEARCPRCEERAEDARAKRRQRRQGDPAADPTGPQRAPWDTPGTGADPRPTVPPQRTAGAAEGPGDAPSQPAADPADDPTAQPPEGWTPEGLLEYQAGREAMAARLRA